MLDAVKNFAKVEVSTGYDNAATSIVLASGEGAKLPAPATDGAFNLVWYNSTDYPDPADDPNVEIVRCTARSTDTLTVARNQESSGASTKNEAGKTYKMILALTSKMITDIGKYAGGLYGINVETLSAGKTLTPGADPIYQYLNPNATSRFITLATDGVEVGSRFVIRNTGTWTSGNVLYTTSDEAIYPGRIVEFIFNGTNWVDALGGGQETGSNFFKNTAYGAQARADDQGTAVGSHAKGHGSGVSIGFNSEGNTNGVAVGYTAYGRTNGVAAGYYANTDFKHYSIALGYYSKCYRYSETSINIDANSAQKNNAVQIRLTKTTSNATPIEMLCGGVANQRATIRPSSILAFTGLVTCRNNTTGECAAWKIEGAIKRDASGNTTMLAAATITIIHKDDAGLDIAVAADDTNEALVITVTGHASNSVQWAAVIDGVETHF